MKKKFDDVSIKTIIGNETSVKGDLNVVGVVRIDGYVDGNVSSNACLMIGESAKINGNIKADSVISRGTVRGNILAENGVKLFSSAVVIGDVITKKVNIQEGVFFEGRCFAIDDASLFEKASLELVSKDVRFTGVGDMNA